MIHFVFYTEKFISPRFGAQTYGPLIFIRPKFKNDVGLLEHEKVHVKQFWRSFGTFGIPYLLSDNARLKYEVEAYKEQLKYSPESAERFAEFISSKYRLKITKDEALKLLRDPK